MLHDKSDRARARERRRVRKITLSHFLHRDSLLNPRFFQNLTQQMWYGNWNLLPLYVECAFNPSVRVFKRSQALTTVMSLLTGRMVQQDLTEEQKNCLLNVENAIMQHSLQVSVI
ncbi:hypothetical protein PR048_031281 [Dryococelus australis]|uniref:Uncharacterized protein n=1 Tax=Dryococelus australis TaxID=614101 RepID=A0ABQ9G8W6_9NEOP|nr:hypothetical protein PR048_031281 [Dryococelus australis]